MDGITDSMDMSLSRLCEMVKDGSQACCSPVQLGSAQSLSWVQLFVTPWTAARQASLLQFMGSQRVGHN